MAERKQVLEEWSSSKHMPRYATVNSLNSRGASSMLIKTAPWQRPRRQFVAGIALATLRRYDAGRIPRLGRRLAAGCAGPALVPGTNDVEKDGRDERAARSLDEIGRLIGGWSKAHDAATACALFPLCGRLRAVCR